MKQTIIDVVKDKKYRVQVGTFDKDCSETVWINGTYRITTNSIRNTYSDIVRAIKTEVNSSVRNILYDKTLFDNTNILSIILTDTIKPNRTTFLKFEFFLKTKDKSDVNTYIRHIKTKLSDLTVSIESIFSKHDFKFI